MQSKNNTKQRNASIQGLRSFKDTLPKNVKKIINKKGHVYSETLSNWKYLVGSELFKFCYPKTFKNSNKFGVSTLMVMVKRGHEVDVEYSKKDILDKDPDVEGFNLGTNIGKVSGQSILHCHFHLIPRRPGDVENPQGGVRSVIPSKQHYKRKK